MTEKEMINEMKQILIDWAIKNDLCFSFDIMQKHSEVLIKNGYTKIPEGSVVLAKEEYEKIKSLYDCGTGYMTSSIGDLPLTVEGLRKAVDEIARLNRVEAELQELNVKYYNEAKDLRREVKQARKETAKEIIELIKEDECADLNYIAQKYGVKL